MSHNTTQTITKTYLRQAQITIMHATTVSKRTNTGILII